MASSLALWVLKDCDLGAQDKSLLIQMIPGNRGMSHSKFILLVSLGYCFKNYLAFSCVSAYPVCLCQEVFTGMSTAPLLEQTENTTSSSSSSIPSLWYSPYRLHAALKRSELLHAVQG